MSPVRAKALLMIPLAAGLGLVAVKAGQHWLDRQVDDRLRLAASAQSRPAAPSVTFGTIVVAAAPLRFGAELAPGVLKEIPWPDGKAPKGAFAHVPEITSGNGKRFVISAMEEDEPVLTSKITGPGQRANLAAVLDEGMKAVTIRVDEVVGVAGFVLPGDRVDVLLTRVIEKGSAFSDVILQDVKVLAIDQTNDDRVNKPAIARSVTLEVATTEAQRLIVAQNVGTMTLALRPVGQATREPNRRVTTADLTSDDHPAASRDADIPVASFTPSKVTVGVVRGVQRTEYSVPAARGE
jgi:pilus assembly protein CpaB